MPVSWEELQSDPRFGGLSSEDRRLMLGNWVRKTAYDNPDMEPEQLNKLFEGAESSLKKYERPKATPLFTAQQYAGNVVRGTLEAFPKYKELMYPEKRKQYLEAPLRAVEAYGPEEGMEVLAEQQWEQTLRDMMVADAEVLITLGGGPALSKAGQLFVKAAKGFAKSTGLAKYARQAVRNTRFGKYFIQASSYMKSPQGQELIYGPHGIQKVQSDWMITAGLHDAHLARAGVFDLTKEESYVASRIFRAEEPGAIKRAAEAVNKLSDQSQIRVMKAINAWQESADTLFRSFQAAGGKLRRPGPRGTIKYVDPEPVDNYLPRMMEPKIRNELLDDIQVFRKLAKEKAATGLEEEQLWNETWEAFLKKRKPSKYTLKAISFNIGRRTASSEAGAMGKIVEALDSDAIGFYGHLEMPRIAKQLPPEFYSDDFGYVTREYVIDAAKRISEIGHWGTEARPKHLDAMLRAIPDVNEQEVGEKLVRAFTGRWSVEDRLRPSIRKAIDYYTSANVMARIGPLGMAHIPNWFQPVISAFAEAGYTRGARGLIKMFLPNQRDLVRGSGVNITQNAMRILAGYDPKVGWIRQATDVALEINTFQPTNRAWNALSASIGKEFAEDMAKIYVGRGWESAIPLWKQVAKSRAKNNLERLGVDLSKIRPDGGLSHSELRTAMYNFASKSQLQRRVFEEPLFFNTPYTRWATLYKRFGYKQMLYARDIALKQFHQNPLPLLRLMAGGFIGGEFVVHGRHLTAELARYALTGDPIEWAKDRADMPIIVRALENFAAIGSLGMLTDLGWSDEGEITPGGVAAHIWLGPLPVQARDIAALAVKPYQELFGQEDLGGILGVLGRNVARQFPLIREAMKEE